MYYLNVTFKSKQKWLKNKIGNSNLEEIPPKKKMFLKIFVVQTKNNKWINKFAFFICFHFVSFRFFFCFFDLPVTALKYGSKPEIVVLVA